MKIYVVVTQSGDEYDEEYSETPGIEAYLDKTNAFNAARKAKHEARRAHDEYDADIPSISVVEIVVKDAPVEVAA